MSGSGQEAGLPETATEGMRAETAGEAEAAEDKQKKQPDQSAENSAESSAENDEQEEAKEELSPEEQILAMQEENSELKDQLLRRQADFENYRKRMAREKEEAITYANQMLLLDLVTVIDDFERAIQSAEDSRDFAAFHEGVVMIEKQMTKMLASKWGLERYDSEGQPFDPNRHAALATEESSEVEVPTVIEDYQRGYLFHERVLRPARVRVAQPTEGQGSGPSQDSEADEIKES
jgi:molecular chaperone GrpE